MKTYFLLFSVVLFTFGCKKALDQAKENAAINAITTGEWKMTKFTKGSSDITTNFTPYTFQFKTDNTVDAIANGVVEKTGTWVVDIPTQSITSGFTNAATPLMLLNGTWKITNNSWTFVEASQTVNGEPRSLRLDK